MNFGQKIMEILRGLGVTYLDFCRKCGASHSSLNRWADGQTPRRHLPTLKVRQLMMSY